MHQEIVMTKQPSLTLSQEQQQPHGTMAQEEQQGDCPTTSEFESHHQRKITLIALVFLIYLEVAGGPYGSEKAVGAAAPLFTLLGFLVFPLAWGVPESLVTAELAAAFPGNGGFVLWADHAFGPLAGSLLGTWKYLGITINIAAYPALVADYLVGVALVIAEPGTARTGAVIGITL